MSDSQQQTPEEQILAEFERRTNATNNNPAPEPEPQEQETAPQQTPSYVWKTYSEEELAAAERVYTWARSLTPDQVEAIDSVLRGNYQPQASTPPPSKEPEVDTDEDEDSAEIRRLNERLAQIEAAQSQRSYQETILSTTQQIEAATASFAQSMNLSEEEADMIAQDLAQSGMFPALSQSFGIADGVRRGLDYFYRQNPKFAEREAERIRAKALADQQRIEEKALKASSVSAAPGSINKPEPAPTSQGRKKRANVSAVAEFLAQNT